MQGMIQGRLKLRPENKLTFHDLPDVKLQFEVLAAACPGTKVGHNSQ